MLASYIARIGPCLPTPISPTPISPTLDQKVPFYLLINLKQNLREEDNLSTRDKSPIPKVSSVQRFYCITKILLDGMSDMGIQIQLHGRN